MDTFEFLQKVMLGPFKAYGLWPSANSSTAYNWWTINVFITIGIGLPLSQIVNCLFADSLDQVVQICLLSSTIIVVTVKSVIVYFKGAKLRELLKVLERMDSDVCEPEHIRIIDKRLRQSGKIYWGFFIAYLSSCFILSIQACFAAKEARTWQSTIMYPYDWAKIEWVYTAVLVYQACSNTILCVFAVSGDTYGVILTNILVAHITILRKKCQKMRESQIKECCLIYEDILRQAKRELCSRF